MFESKLGVVRGESLADDMEGGGEELVLNRWFTPSCGWPKEMVDIIRPNDDGTPVSTSGGSRALDIRNN